MKLIILKRKKQMTDIWSYILAAGGILQIWLVGKKLKIGWLFGLGTSILWVLFALQTGQYGFIISAAVFGYLHIKNYIDWGKK
jgi:nicotinamide riboside transporter PnuC